MLKLSSRSVDVSNISKKIKIFSCRSEVESAGRTWDINFLECYKVVLMKTLEEEENPFL